MVDLAEETSLQFLDYPAHICLFPTNPFEYIRRPFTHPPSPLSTYPPLPPSPVNLSTGCPPLLVRVLSGCALEIHASTANPAAHRGEADAERRNRSRSAGGQASKAEKKTQET